MSYPTSPVWTPGSWIFDKNAPIAVDGTPVAQPNFTDSPTVIWTLDPLTEKVTANLAGVNGLTFVYSGSVDPTVTTGLLTGTLYINTTSGAVFQLQVVGSSNVWVVIGSIVETVASVFGRIGTIAAQFGDYSFSQIAGVATASQIPSLNQISGSVTPSQVPSLNLLSGAITSSQLPFPVVSGNINNIITVDGVRYTTVQQALAALPAGGGVIDMRGNSSSAALALGTFDVGNNGPGVTLLLGPFSYTATRIVLRTGTKIYGMGGLGGGATGTSITAISTTNPLVVCNTVPSTDQPAQHVEVRDIQFIGAASGVNTANAMFFDGSTSTTGLGGIWYSRFENLNFSNFAGHVIYFKGATGTGGANGVNQFITLTNVVVFRTLNGGNAFRLEGANYQFFLLNVEFDSALYNTGIDTSATPNIFLGGGPTAGTTGYPYIIKFDGLTSQGAANLVQIDGANNITFDHAHHEQGYIGYLLTYGTNGANVPSNNIIVTDSSFNGNTAINSGSGAMLKTTSANINGIVFNNNLFLSPGGANPDHVIWDTVGTSLIYAEANEINTVSGIFFFEYGYLVDNLPSAGANPGKTFYVTDSSVISAEGQTAVGGGSTKALVFSNGSVWKAF